jgi:hypothetical protein
MLLIITQHQLCWILASVTMKSAVFWNVMSCSPAEIHRRFGEFYFLHRQGQRYAKSAKSKKQVPYLRVLDFLVISVLVSDTIFNHVFLILRKVLNISRILKMEAVYSH